MSNVIQLPIGDERDWLGIQEVIDREMKKYGYSAELRAHVLKATREVFLQCTPAKLLSVRGGATGGRKSGPGLV